jgi:hypothetical protein
MCGGAFRSLAHVPGQAEVDTAAPGPDAGAGGGDVTKDDDKDAHGDHVQG